MRFRCGGDARGIHLNAAQKLWAGCRHGEITALEQFDRSTLPLADHLPGKQSLPI